MLDIFLIFTRISHVSDKSVVGVFCIYSHNILISLGLDFLKTQKRDMLPGILSKPGF